MSGNPLLDFFIEGESVTYSIPKMGMSLALSYGFEALLAQTKYKSLGNAVAATGQLDLLDPFNQGGGWNREMYENYAQAAFKGALNTADQVTPEIIEEYRKLFQRELGSPPNQMFDDYEDSTIKTAILYLERTHMVSIPPPPGCVPELTKTGYLRGTPDPTVCGEDYTNDFYTLVDEDLDPILDRVRQSRTTSAEESANTFLDGLGFIDTLTYRVYKKESEKLQLPLVVIASLTGACMLFLVAYTFLFRQRSQRAANTI